MDHLNNFYMKCPGGASHGEIQNPLLVADIERAIAACGLRVEEIERRNSEILQLVRLVNDEVRALFARHRQGGKVTDKDMPASSKRLDSIIDEMDTMLLPVFERLVEWGYDPEELSR